MREIKYFVRYSDYDGNICKTQETSDHKKAYYDSKRLNGTLYKVTEDEIFTHWETTSYEIQYIDKKGNIRHTKPTGDLKKVYKDFKKLKGTIFKTTKEIFDIEAYKERLVDMSIHIKEEFEKLK